MRRLRKSRAAARMAAAPGHDRWLVSYADFVTLLFALFVVLFASAQQSKQTIRTVATAIHSGFKSLGSDQPQGHTGTEDTPEDLHPGPWPDPGTQSDPAAQPFDTRAIQAQLQSVLGDSIAKHEIVMQQTRDGLVISLRELGFFNSGEAKLLPGAAEKLLSTAAVLKQHHLELRVEGHSDDQPIHNATFNSNWELSTARATSVLSILVDDAKFDPNNISVSGFGAFRPLASNATPEGRRTNRRVDLVVIAPRNPSPTQ